MKKPRVKRTQRTRKLTKSEAEKYNKIRRRVEEDRKAGEYGVDDPTWPKDLGDMWELGFAIQALKQERHAQGKTLNDIEATTGIRNTTLSRLESGKVHNPTLATLTRYARALGKRIELTLVSDKQTTRKSKKKSTKRRTPARTDRQQ